MVAVTDPIASQTGATITAPHRSTIIGTLVGLAVLGGATAALLPFRTGASRATPALVLVVPCVVAALVGRRVAAALTAVAAAAIYSFSFVPPYDRVSIAHSDDAVALVVFLVVALTIGTLVAIEAERGQAAEERSELVRRLYQHNDELREEANRGALMARLAEQRSALLRSVSHDLRTPLGTIQAVASDLRDGTTYAPETRDRLLDLVADEAARLDRIVGNLLSMNRIESGALQPDLLAVALDELITDRVERMERVLVGRAVLVELAPGLPLVDADYSQLDQVITNLLENAARHTPAGTPVSVSAAPAGPMVEVVVRDDGAGFDLGAPTTGMGLAICKAIVEAHGGRIWVDGNEVHFTVAAHA